MLSLSQAIITLLMATELSISKRTSRLGIIPMRGYMRINAEDPFGRPGKMEHAHGL